MSSLILPYAGLDAGQPASLFPDYRSTVARSPRQAPIAIPQTLTEVTGPTDWSRLMGPAMADLTTQHKAEPVSYTHLDVYKRQASRPSRSSRTT